MLAASNDGSYAVELSSGETITASAVIIAAGWGIIGQRSADGSNPISGWGVGLSENVVPVDTEKYQSTVPGIFIIGDMCFYPGKLRLILSGFHEAALATQAIRKLTTPRTCSPGQYTSAARGLKKKLRSAGPE
jgi:thioredoxin reductase